ncbi:SMI1/KNR4 family protein [Ruminiclostridium cellobioparum]|uniref:SMI1/KNR4 family protein n=1 Tax=Ruminiclostridium cellobioparum TaxID=29355 RepID=UPI00048325B6|nr:SMI1/KNR4 family protein [Ruminiclostridium cellobioparum]
MIDISSLTKFELYHAVDDNEIDKAEKELFLKFPKVFRELLHYTNGLVADDGGVIFGTDIIVERNRTYEVDEYAKGYVAVGSSGGGKFYLMPANVDATELLQVDCGDMTPKHAKLVSTDFASWINKGAINVDIIDECEEITCNELCDLILIAQPAGGAQDLRKIQEKFNIDKGLFDLLKGSKNLPYLMMKDISLDIATKDLLELGELSKILKLVPAETH